MASLQALLMSPAALLVPQPALALEAAAPLSTSTAPADLPPIYRRLPPLPTKLPELPPLRAPAMHKESLPNGLQVFLLEDREVPLVRGSLLMPGGQVSSPADKVGLASISASVQRSGGSLSHPAEAMDERLEDLAAALEASAGNAADTFDFTCAAGDTRELLALLAELLTQPALPRDKLQLAQAQVTNVIEHRDDSAGAVARRELSKLLFGPASIYARTPSLSGVASITQADLAQHIATWQRPDSALLGLVGDFDTAEAMALIRETLGGWAPAPGQPQAPPARPRESLPDLPAVLQAAAAAAQQQQQQQASGAAGAAGEEQQQPAQQPAQTVWLVERPGAGQASLAAGEPGVLLSDPDSYALDVLASALNGFGGVLFDELRTRQGLAYSVSAGWDSPVDHRGIFLATADTAQPARLLTELQRLLERAAAEPLPPASLAQARAALLNSFVFNFSSSAAQLQRSLVYQLLGLPQDFLFTYRDRMEAVTAADVQAAAAKHLHPREQVIVVVGDAGLRAQLGAAGFSVRLLKPAPAD